MMETISYQKEVKALKEHKCDFCCSKITVGQKYYTSTHKEDGGLYDWKSHIDCSRIAEKLDMYISGEPLSSDDFQECIHQSHDDLLIGLIPEEDVKRFSDIIQQLRYVRFDQKLKYVIRHYLYKPNPDATKS